jgi:UDP-glucose 4-epimerase
MIKKYLITGGAGFVGKNLIELLLHKEKCNIISLDNYYSGSKRNHIKNNRVKYISGSTIKINSIFKKKKFDKVFHFGEFSRIVQSFKNVNDCYNFNINGTFQVIKFCLKNNTPLIYSGSSSIFGNDMRDQNLSPYAWTKAKNIELIKNYSKWFGLKYVITYFYNVYGLGQIDKGPMKTVVGYFERLYKNNKPLTIVGNGKYKRDFTHVSDIANGCYLASKKVNNSEYMLGTGISTSILKLAKYFNHKTIFIKKRKGERFGNVANTKMGFKKINYKPKIILKNYIEDFISKNNKKLIFKR